MAAEVLLRSKESQPPSKLLSQKYEEEFPKYLAVKITRVLVKVRWRAAEKPGVSLKGPSTESLPHKHLSYDPEYGQDLAKAKDIQRETELSGFR